MASVFTTMPDKTIKGFAGKEYSIPMYLQFVPGIVIDAIHSEEHARYKGDTTINTIIAKPHITEKIFKRKANLGEKERYYPLFRTMHDVPSKGDPVLLCTIGKINYYLGPLNTDTNSPTWNDDPSDLPELEFEKKDNTLALNKITLTGQTENFNKEVLYSRLTKKRKKNLDYGEALRETTGDTIFEGRHGNSLRIGSRSNNPYLFISNGRFATSNVESINDGSLISITSNGTIQQHVAGGLDVDENLVERPVKFQLGSDSDEENTYPIGDIYSNLNNGVDIEQEIYGYNRNQMLLHSDRITLNSKLDDIFVSSIKDIYIGSGRHLSINARKSINVLSDNVNIGNPNKATMENMVLGNKLQDVLVEIVNLLGRLQTTTSLGLQTPLTVGQISGDVKPGEPIVTVISNLETKIQNIISTKHKIEQG